MTTRPIIFLDMDGVISTRRAHQAQAGKPLPGQMRVRVHAFGKYQPVVRNSP